MSGKDHNMPKSQQTLLAIITFVFLLEIILTAFFISFSAPIFKGLTIIHGILIVVFLTRQIKRKGFWYINRIIFSMWTPLLFRVVFNKGFLC